MHVGKLAAVLLLAPVLLLGFGGRSAEAGSCAAGSSCDILLNNTNTSQLSPISVKVNINNTGAATVLTVTLVSDPISNTFQGFVAFDYNSAATATITGDDATKWTAGSNGNGDGFGKFVTTESRSGNPSGVQTTLTFTLSSLVTSFSENATGAEFAVHAQYSGNCSGWVSDGTTDQGSNANCTGTSVAEPGVLFLVGSGMVGLVYLRRRWSGKE